MWSPILTCCALLLLLPDTSSGKSPVIVLRKCMMITNIVGLTLLHSFIPQMFFFALTICLSTLHLLTLTSRWNLFTVIQGMVLALLVYQAMRLLPFDTFCGVSTFVLFVLVHAGLLILFSGNEEGLWGMWPISYLSSVIIGALHVGSIHVAIDQGKLDLAFYLQWFWCMEFLLCTIFSLKHRIFAIFRENQRKIV